MFKLTNNQPPPARPFLVNDHTDYKFAELAKMPETQLVMLVPRREWQNLRFYIAEYEDVGQAGQYGARPGDFEWEWIDSPEAVRWWRRDVIGAESLFGMAVAVPRRDVVELYGLVEVDEDSPHWAEVIPEEVADAMPIQAQRAARATGTDEKKILYDLYRDYFRKKGMLTSDRRGEPALRRGTIREVERFRNALRGLLERSARSQPPAEHR